MGDVNCLQQGRTAGEPFHYRLQSPFLHNLINIGALFGISIGLLLVMFMATKLRFVLYFPLATLLFGYLFYSMGVLVLHESSHHMFVLAKKPGARFFWNRIFGKMVSVPLFIDYDRRWGRGHLVHHKFPVTQDDPVICHPLTGVELFKKLAKILLIPCYLQISFLFKSQGSEFSCPSADPGKSSWRFFVYGWTFWIALITALSLAWGWKMTYYVFPAVFFGMPIVMALQEIRVSLEHGGKIGDQRDPNLRSRTTLSPVCFLFAPWNSNYHFEHHLNAEIPWYRLGQYHRSLSKIVSEKIRPLVYNRHLLRQLKETSGPHPGDAQKRQVPL